ncbi:Phage protein [Erwinia rhapontici]|uniref:hypothetical protein n=1 Tax=Erwinia rhapontici TaxID=55212 RepID=UPI003D363EC1
MEDRYIKGIKKSLRDDAITQVAKKAQRKEMGGKMMVVAIENDEGEIYRVLSIDGLGGYIALAQGIAGLGLKDLHAENLNPGQYDSLFVRS